MRFRWTRGLPKPGVQYITLPFHLPIYLANWQETILCYDIVTILLVVCSMYSISLTRKKELIRIMQLYTWSLQYDVNHDMVSYCNESTAIHKTLDSVRIRCNKANFNNPLNLKTSFKLNLANFNNVNLKSISTTL